MWHFRKKIDFFSHKLISNYINNLKFFSFPSTILVPLFENINPKKFYGLVFHLKIMSENSKKNAWELNQNKSTSVISSL